MGNVRRFGGAVAGAFGLGAGMIATRGVDHRLEAGVLSQAIANRAAFAQGGNARDIQKNLFAQTEAVAKPSTRSQGTVLEALDKMVAPTGDLATSQRLIQTLVETADATGLLDDGLLEVAESTGKVFAGLQMMGYSTESAFKETEKIVDDLVAQSSIGMIEVADIAKELPKIIATASRSNDPAKAIRTVTGLANIAVATSATDAAEATTSAMRFSDDLIGKNKNLKKMGVNVFDKKTGNIRDLETLIPEIIKATGGSLSKLKSEAKFGVRGMKVIEGYASRYRGAADKDLALKEIVESIKRYQTAELDPETKKANLEAFRNTDQAKIDKQMRELEKAFAKELVPLIVKDLLPAFKELTPVLVNLMKEGARLASWFAENPFKGIVAIIGASVAADVAAAGIKNALIGAIAPMTGLTGAATGATGALGKFAGALGPIILALGAAATAYDQFTKLKDENKNIGKAAKELSGLDLVSLFPELHMNLANMAAEKLGIDSRFATPALNKLADKTSAIDDKEAVAKAVKRTGKSEEEIAAGHAKLQQSWANDELFARLQANYQSNQQLLNDAVAYNAEQLKLGGDAVSVFAQKLSNLDPNSILNKGTLKPPASGGL